ncbi:TIGR02678 family protein [Nocardia cyriacigeorgica]|uniref:TIGR02678 family protein n=1 Tax=Nocardia cyriacigeorgica TaxID=135487 RepID=A0A5R8PE26_9NOCA|nr:TIGR02678 family protein [Nocardia cyriacigeorgica]TLG10915.1 TIGR02678 family protein [Nocardia cyriacigeorgica]
MSALDDALAASRTAERRKAARALLRHPLLRASGNHRDLFGLVTKHQQELRKWFDRETGWRLITTSEAARLAKLASTPDPTHPATEVGGSRMPFGRRRYVLTCLALAVLERCDQQITLGRLAEQVMLAAADPELAATGIVFTMQRRDERSDMVAVVRLLLDLGVLDRVAGEEQAFMNTSGDVLYDVRRRTLSMLCTSTRGPSMIADAVDRCAALTFEAPPATDDLRNRRIRHRITRILLDEPVLYYDSLREDEMAYLTGQRTAICRRVTEFIGLIAEVRAEGIAMVDPYDDLTDVRMPEVGTDGHVTLLLAEHLSGSLGTPVAVTELHAKVRELAEKFTSQRFWRAAAALPGAEMDLVAAALTTLTALRLVRYAPGQDWVTPLPAIARYRLGEPTITEPGAATPAPTRKRR